MVSRQEIYKEFGQREKKNINPPKKKTKKLFTADEITSPGSTIYEKRDPLLPLLCSTLKR